MIEAPLQLNQRAQRDQIDHSLGRTMYSTMPLQRRSVGYRKAKRRD
jgi:hypothetical protein